MDDYVARAIAYAKGAIKDKKRLSHGVLIRQASTRFIEDLKRAKRKNRTFIFDEWHANDVCDFIEKLPHVEGVWAKPTIELHDSQVFFLVQLFGFRKTESKNLIGYGEFRPRRFTTALFAIARKNAKSTMSAAVLLYCQTCEPEVGGQVISAATTFSQAGIIFNIAKAMVDKTQDLRDAFGLECWAKSISRVETGSSFKPVHSKASTQDGLNPSHVGLDEIHAHKSGDLLNVLQSAAGARENPLWLLTTTEGYTNSGPWAEYRQFSKRLLAGVFGHDADHFLVVFYALDNENKSKKIKEDDEFDETKWVKANPLMDVNPLLMAAIRKEAVEAKQMPSKLAEFRIKRLNRPASTADGWIDLTKWQKCDGEVDLSWLAQYPCWGGLDLSSTRDLTAFRLTWNVDGVIYTHGLRWVPDEEVTQRTERGTVPYAGWVESGHIRQTEGNVVDYRVIESEIIEICSGLNLQNIAFDDWNSQDLVTRLTEAGIPMIKFIQGPKSYHPAMQALEIAYVSGGLAHGGDPVLGWCASNLITRTDANMNLAPDKKKSADKIDDAVALLMAIGIMILNEETVDLNDFLNDPIIL